MHPVVSRLHSPARPCWALPYPGRPPNSNGHSAALAASCAGASSRPFPTTWQALALNQCITQYLTRLLIVSCACFPSYVRRGGQSQSSLAKRRAYLPY